MKNAVANKEQLLTLLKENGPIIRGYGIKKMGIFGSFMRDKGIRKKSDVDFIIEFEKEEFELSDLFDLGYFLEELLGRKVELIRPCALGSLSRSHILNELENVPLGSTQASACKRSHRKNTRLHERQNA